MTQGPSQNLIPLTQLSLSEMLGGALNSLRRMPKTMLGIGLFAAFIIELSSLLVSALIIRGGGDLSAPQLPEPNGRLKPSCSRPAKPLALTASKQNLVRLCVQ